MSPEAREGQTGPPWLLHWTYGTPPDGTLDLVRDLAGIAGIGLLTATITGAKPGLDRPHPPESLERGPGSLRRVRREPTSASPIRRNPASPIAGCWRRGSAAVIRPGTWSRFGKGPALGVLAGFSRFNEGTMATADSTGWTITVGPSRALWMRPRLAAVAFLARYSGQTLDAYRHDLRNLFQRADDHDLAGLEATRAHLELYRSSMEERGLAASTIDRRLTTACGILPFCPHRRRIASNPAQYVRRPTVHPSERRGLDRGELGRFLFTAERFDHPHTALAVLLGLIGLRVGKTCGANIEDMSFERGHRVLRIIGKGNKPVLISLVPRTARTIDWRSAYDARGRSWCATTDNAWTAGRGPGRRLHADPRTTTVYDRRRQDFDRHADYKVVAFVARG